MMLSRYPLQLCLTLFSALAQGSTTDQRRMMRSHTIVFDDSEHRRIDGLGSRDESAP